MNREKFEEKFGKIEIIENAQKRIVDSCVTMATADPQANFKNPKDLPKLMNGKIYNIGYLREGLTPENANIDWDNLAENVAFLQDVSDTLNEAGCLHSSNTDCDYYPIIFHEKISPENFNGDLVKALGIADDFIKNPTYQRIADYPVFDYESFGEDEEEEMLDCLSEEEISAYQVALEKMNGKLANIKNIAIASGYDRFPLFKLGQTEKGDWIGFMTLAANPDFYC